MCKLVKIRNSLGEEIENSEDLDEGTQQYHNREAGVEKLREDQYKGYEK